MRPAETESRNIFTRVMELHFTQPWATERRHSIGSLLCRLETDDQKEVVIDLLERFCFQNGSSYEGHLRSIASKINSRFDAKDCCIIAKHLGDGPDSSQAFLQSLKSRFGPYRSKGWKEENFSTGVESVLNDRRWKEFVIVDDFSGSGKQLKNFCSRFSKISAHSGRTDVELHAFFLAVMEKTCVRDYPKILKSASFEIELKRGISDHHTPLIREKHFKAMDTIEQKFKFSKKYRFGFDQSETLYYCETLSVPNNVFPVFWMSSGGNKSPIFERL